MQVAAEGETLLRIRIAAALFVLPALALATQEKRRISAEWVFSDAAEELTDLPAAAWASANKILLEDPRRPEAERTLERLDAGSGRRWTVHHEGLFVS